MDPEWWTRFLRRLSGEGGGCNDDKLEEAVERWRGAAGDDTMEERLERLRDEGSCDDEGAEIDIHEARERIRKLIDPYRDRDLDDEETAKVRAWRSALVVIGGDDRNDEENAEMSDLGREALPPREECDNDQ